MFIGELTAHFGKVGSLYYECARGIDERPVEAVRIRKSIGCERTLERDISSRSSVFIELYHMAVELIERLQRKEFKGNTLTLKIKFHDFSQITRSITQSQELTTLDRVLPLAKELLKTVEYEQHPTALSDFPFPIRKKKPMSNTGSGNSSVSSSVTGNKTEPLFHSNRASIYPKQSLCFTQIEPLFFAG